MTNTIDEAETDRVKLLPGAQASEDPMFEDVRRAPDGRELAIYIADRIAEMRWRQVARDNQVAARELMADLARSPEEIVAEKETLRRTAPKPPESPRAARRLMGRLIAKCETSVETLLKIDTAQDLAARLMVAAQLVHAVANAARVMKDIGDRDEDQA